MAREGMSNVIQSVRELTYAGTSDFLIGTVSYFSDDHMQAALDDHRQDFQFLSVDKIPEQAVGSIVYKQLRIPENTESGTVFYIQTSGGVEVGTGLYSVDHQRGMVTFTNDTAGTAFFVTGRSYDIYGAAVDVMERKAAYVAEQVDWKSDNHSFASSQAYQHYKNQAAKFRAMAKPISVTIYRGDM